MEIVDTGYIEKLNREKIKKEEQVIKNNILGGIKWKSSMR